MKSALLRASLSAAVVACLARPNLAETLTRSQGRVRAEILREHALAGVEIPQDAPVWESLDEAAGNDNPRSELDLASSALQPLAAPTSGEIRATRSTPRDLRAHSGDAERAEQGRAEAWWPAALGEKPAFPEPAASYLEANAHYYTNEVALGANPSRAEKVDAYLRGRILPDWKGLLPHLPTRAGGTLNIGSGIGAIDLLLFRQLGAPQMTMVDKGRREQSGRAFDVLGISREFLTANGVPAAKLALADASKPGELAALAASSCDLVLSLRALAYLFPYELYRETILKALSPGGTLIMDVRKLAATRKLDPAGHAELVAAGIPEHGAVFDRLARDFQDVQIIGNAPGRVRVRASGKR